MWHVLGAGDLARPVLEVLALRCGYRVGEICAALGCCERHLHALFVRDVGLAPKEWLKLERMVVARRMLKGGERPDCVAEELGFSTLNNFRREFRGVYGVSPLDFQRSFFDRMRKDDRVQLAS
jgi:AraC-like DNA-binding protein